MRHDHQVYRSPQNPVRKCRRGPVNVIGGQNDAGSEEKSKTRLSHCSTCHAIPPGGWFGEISIEDPPPSVPITTKFGVDVWNHPTQRVWWSKPCSVCPLRSPTREKRHWGYLAPDIHLTRVARDQCGVRVFSVFFLRIVWNDHISSEFISWNDLNIKPRPNLWIYMNFSKSVR